MSAAPLDEALDLRMSWLPVTRQSGRLCPSAFLIVAKASVAIRACVALSLQSPCTRSPSWIAKAVSDVMRAAAALINSQIGREVIELSIHDQYHNLADVVTQPENAHLITNARAAFEACGIKPFTTPMRGQAEGIVHASMPLSREGQLIEDFWIRFHEGKAVEWHAEKNENLLTNIITADEGAAYLGECALIPYESPIRQSGILFYNTLYDENASCHLALGMGFADCIRDFENRTLEECRALGVNDSMIHVDFMIGTADMKIDAITRDGKTVPIFRNGSWA